MSATVGPRPAADGPDLTRWAPVVAELPWASPPEPLWEPGPRQGRWFGGGRLNAATACVGQHARTRPDAVAIIWEGEPGDRRTITYAALDAEVAALARGLAGIGVHSGDVVALHLGQLPETVVALMACARLGAVCAVIPTPLPPEALAVRLTHLAPRVLFTQDGAWRRGSVAPLKARVDDALSAVDVVEHTVVVRRTGIDIGWFEGDRWYHDLVDPGRRRRPAGPGAGAASADRSVRQPVDPDQPAVPPAVQPAVQPADHPADQPLLMVSLANRQGRPLSVTLGTAGILTSALAMHRHGLVDGPVTWCAGDISWLGTLAHGIYGPLVAGETAVLFEGTLDMPTHERAWQILTRHEVTTLLTTPSVLRMMRSWSFEFSTPPDPGPLRRVVAFGEPVDPDVREWARAGLGGPVASAPAAGVPGAGMPRRRGIPVADAWGQVELGGIVLIDDPLRPDRLPQVGEWVAGPDWSAVPDGGRGELVLSRPWPGTMVSAAGPAEALDEAHWRRLPGSYTTGDLARHRHGGTLEFLGRTDEVVSVSGQLVSLNEVHSTLRAHPFVAAVDVFERRDQVGARVLAAAVVLTADAAGLGLDAIARDLGQSVRETLGGLARPRLILVVDRFGDELRGDERRRALASLPVTDLLGPTRVSWAQVLASAGAVGS